jgi:hypothetical protein
MEEIAVIFLLWLALQIPLGIFVGKCIGFGMSEARDTKQQASSPTRFGLGMTKCWGRGSAWRVDAMPYQLVTAKHRHQR